MKTHRRTHRTAPRAFTARAFAQRAWLGAWLSVSAAACSGASSKPAQDARSQAVAAAPVPTAQEVIARAEATVRSGVLLAQDVRERLADSRRGVDIIRTTCLDDTRTEIDVNVRTAQSHLDALRAASELERRKHEATVLEILGQRLRSLRTEADQCAGQGLYDTARVGLVAEIQPGVLPATQAQVRPAPVAPAAVNPPPPTSEAR